MRKRARQPKAVGPIDLPPDEPREPPPGDARRMPPTRRLRGCASAPRSVSSNDADKRPIAAPLRAARAATRPPICALRRNDDGRKGTAQTAHITLRRVIRSWLAYRVARY